MSNKYNTKQLISAGHYATQMSEIWCRKIQAFLRCSNFLIGIFYFASPCTSRRRLVHYVVPCAAASPPCGPAMQWLLSSVRHSSPVVCLLLVRLVDQQWLLSSVRHSSSVVCHVVTSRKRIKIDTHSYCVTLLWSWHHWFCCRSTRQQILSDAPWGRYLGFTYKTCTNINTAFCWNTAVVNRAWPSSRQLCSCYKRSATVGTCCLQSSSVVLTT